MPLHLNRVDRLSYEYSVRSGRPLAKEDTILWWDLVTEEYCAGIAL